MCQVRVLGKGAVKVIEQSEKTITAQPQRHGRRTDWSAIWRLVSPYGISCWTMQPSGSTNYDSLLFECGTPSYELLWQESSVIWYVHCLRHHRSKKNANGCMLTSPQVSLRSSGCRSRLLTSMIPVRGWLTRTRQTPSFAHETRGVVYSVRTT
jgi:hypothetical protein